MYGYTSSSGIAIAVGGSVLKYGGSGTSVTTMAIKALEDRTQSRDADVSFAATTSVYSGCHS